MKQVFPEELKPKGNACNGAGKKHIKEGGIDGTVMD